MCRKWDTLIHNCHFTFLLTWTQVPESILSDCSPTPLSLKWPLLNYKENSPSRSYMQEYRWDKRPVNQVNCVHFSRIRIAVIILKNNKDLVKLKASILRPLAHFISFNIFILKYIYLTATFTSMSLKYLPSWIDWALLHR